MSSLSGSDGEVVERVILPANWSNKRRLASLALSDSENMVAAAPEGVVRSASPKTQMEEEKRMRRVIANSNERRRMQSINNGFSSLRNLLPHQEGEKLSKAAILQLAVQYIYQLEQEKTQLLTRNCELKRHVDQLQCRDVNSVSAAASVASNDGSHSSGTPSPSVTASAAVGAGVAHQVASHTVPVPSTASPGSGLVKKEYLNQMHLPPLKRKRAYALAEAEAEASEADVECEKRARNIASVVAAVGNSAGLMHHHDSPPVIEHNYTAVADDGVGVSSLHVTAPPLSSSEDVKPMKHVVMGVRSPPPISVSVSQQPVYVQSHQHAQQLHVGGSETLHQQVMALQRELDQERGYRIALEDKTRSLEAKVHSNAGPRAMTQQSSYQQQTSQQQQIHHLVQQQTSGGGASAPECATVSVVQTSRGGQQQQQQQQQQHQQQQQQPTSAQIVSGVEVATLVEAPVGYSRLRLATAVPHQTYRLAKNENGDNVLFLVQDSHGADQTITVEQPERHVIHHAPSSSSGSSQIHHHYQHQEQRLVHHGGHHHQAQQQQQQQQQQLHHGHQLHHHSSHQQVVHLVAGGPSSGATVQMQDASSGTEDAPPLGKPGSLPPVNLAFSRLGKGGLALPAVVALRGAQVSVSAAPSQQQHQHQHQHHHQQHQHHHQQMSSSSPNEHNVGVEQHQQEARMAPLRLQEPPVSLAVAQTLTSADNLYMSDHKPFQPKSLETIVEAIRHLEGDSMFESMVTQHSSPPPSSASPPPSSSSSSSSGAASRLKSSSAAGCKLSSSSSSSSVVVEPAYLSRHHGHSLVVVGGGGATVVSDDSVIEDDEQPLALTVDAAGGRSSGPSNGSSCVTVTTSRGGQPTQRGGVIMVKPSFSDSHSLMDPSQL